MIEELYSKLKKNQKKFKSLLKRADTNAYRLYDRDIPSYQFIVDIYNDAVLIYDKTNEKKDPKEKVEQIEKTILSFIKDQMNVDDSMIFFKKRDTGKSTKNYSKISEQSIKTHVKENNIEYEINLSDYLDVGLFLDHRLLRRIVQNSKAHNVLNLFCYTSSIGLNAAYSGAKTTNVDLSKNYLDWSIRNYKLNNINTDEHSFVNEDCISFLKSQSEKYDLIIIDPPSFSNSKKLDYTFKIESDYKVLIKEACKLLTPKGKIYFSGNLRNFKFEHQHFHNLEITDITAQTIPEDFHDKKIHFCYKLTKTE